MAAAVIPGAVMTRESPSERAARQSRVSAERRPERIDALKRDIREQVERGKGWQTCQTT